VIEHYTDMPVLGAMAHEPQLALAERHLGLTTSLEFDDARMRVQRIGERVAEQVDLSRVLELACGAPPCPLAAAGATPAQAPTRPVRIAIARDKAFGFYYPDDLTALRAAGVELLPFDTLHDARLPAADGLFIGGGFPEVFMDELQANASLRDDIAAAIDAGLPAYAECGGLMYLARSLRWQGRVCRMVGAIPGDAVMHERPVGRGYVRLQPTAGHPWAAPGEVLAHEFHHSSLDHLPSGQHYAYRVARGHGIDGRNDGLLHRNLLASYAHLRGDGWAERFVGFVRRVGAERRDTRSRPQLERLVA